MIRYVKAHATGPTATASDTGRAIEATAVCPDAQRKQSHGGEPLKTLHGAGRHSTGLGDTHSSDSNLNVAPASDVIP